MINKEDVDEDKDLLLVIDVPVNSELTLEEEVNFFNILEDILKRKINSHKVKDSHKDGKCAFIILNGCEKTNDPIFCNKVHGSVFEAVEESLSKLFKEPYSITSRTVQIEEFYDINNIDAKVN